MDQEWNRTWAMLRFSKGRVAYQDSKRRKFRVGRSALERRLLELIAELPLSHWNSEASSPVPLALYLEPGAELTYHQCEVSAFELAHGVDPARMQCVWLAPRRPVRRSGFQLPLRLSFLDSTLRDALFALKDAHWWIGQAWGSGITIQPEVRDTDLLFTTGEVPNYSRIPVSRRPRLIVAVNEAEIKAALPPAGVAAIYAQVGKAETNSFIYRLLLGLVHDFPIHEALHSTGLQRSLLICDPAGNQSLRIADAAQHLRNEATKLNTGFAGAKVEELIRNLKPGHVAEFGPQLREIHQSACLVAGAANRAKNTGVEFSRESFGMVPLAEVRRDLMEAGTIQRDMVVNLRSLTKKPGFREVIKEQQTRRADVTLQRMDTLPEKSNVDPGAVLRLDSRYGLTVQIGHRSEQSLLTDPPPPVDPLLPKTRDRRGHKLEVTIQEKDFKLLSPRVRIVWLPELGASQTAVFTVRAPAREGSAKLRISIYHRNHLLQSFLLETMVGGVEGRAEVGGLSAHLEYSRTERFRNLDELAPRALAISMNETQGTHELQLKEGESAEPISLPTEVYDKQVALFREILNGATFETAANGRRRERLYPNKAAFEDTVRRFAAQGSDLYDGIFLRAGKELQAKLRLFKKDANKTVQVTRFDPTFVVPWSIVYDYRLPKDTVPPICADPDTCGHGPKDEVLCLNGFWGVRHRIEELMGNGVLADAALSIRPAPAKGAIRIAADPGITEGTDIRDYLMEKIGRDDIAWGPVNEGALIDCIWNSAERPCMLLVLGHLDAQAQTYGSSFPRIALGGDQWLFAKSLSQKFQDDAGWKEPNTLVMLMACSSGATTSETMVNFETVLSQVGAGAVVATEINVYSGFVAGFAKEVMVTMWHDQRALGEALRLFRRQTLKAGNPLGFVLHCIGNSDLKVN